MEAPLNKKVRRILANRRQSEILMSHVIAGQRTTDSSDITIDDTRYRLQRVVAQSPFRPKK
jgi:hypothetical protein